MRSRVTDKFGSYPSAKAKLAPGLVHRRHKGPHKIVIIAIARRLITMANATLKTGKTWRRQASVRIPG